MKNKIKAGLIFGMFFWWQAGWTQPRNEYLDEKNKPCHADDAFKHRIIEQTDSSWRVQEYLVRPRVLLMEAKGRGHHTGELGAYWTQKFFYNGQLKSLMQAQASYFDGEQICIYPNGILQDSFFYQNGLMVGHQMGWYADGSLRYDMQLDSSNQGQGICVGFFPNGQMAFKGRLAPGFRKTSDWFYYREDGTRAAVYRYGPVADSLQNLAPVLVQDKYEGIFCDTLVKPRTIYWFNEQGEQTHQPEQEDHPARFQKKGPPEWAYYLQRELVNVPRLVQARKLVYEVHFLVNTLGKIEMVALDKKNLDDLDYGIKKIFERANDWVPAFHANRVQPMLMSQSLRLGFDQ